jgi:hypothetical protein
MSEKDAKGILKDRFYNHFGFKIYFEDEILVLKD